MADETQDTTHETQDTTHDTMHETQDTTHETQDTTHETQDAMQEHTAKDTQAEGVMFPRERPDLPSAFDELQQTDILGMIVKKKGADHSNDDYVELFKLASLNRGWRKAIPFNIKMRLSAEGGRFMLDIGILYARRELAAIVRGLLHFKYMKYEALHLHGITALHVAVSTGHFMAQARALKTTAEAGGLEAVLSPLFMCRHSSNVALSIVCVRMLNLYAAYNKRGGCRWGLWTERHLNMGLECVTGAMRKFPDNLDLQCCATSCLATLCLQDGIPQDAHMHICQAHVASQGVLPLLMVAMHAHENAAMHADARKLFFMYEPQADSAGLEAVLSALFLNLDSSNVELCVVCVRMLKLYAAYNKPEACTWGVWADTQLDRGLEGITGAMRKFPDDLDLQCCAISCLATLCLQDGIPQDAHMSTSKNHVNMEGVLGLLMIAMHTHESADMYVDVCQLFSMLDSNVVEWDPVPGVSSQVVALQALRHSLTLGHIRSICLLSRFLYWICKSYQNIQADLSRNPAVMPLCLQILQQVRANMETDTPEQAVLKQTTLVMATTFITKITESRDAGLLFVQNAGSIALVVRTITDSHELSMLQPSALFQHEPFITAQMCHTVQHDLCEMLANVELDGYIFPIMQCGAMQQIVNVIRETESKGVRLRAIQTVRNFATDDNGERLIFLKAGGLQVFVDHILPLASEPANNRCKGLYGMCLVLLAEFPVYATAMFDLGFIGLLQNLPPSNYIGELIPLLQQAEHNPVYPP